MVAIVVNIMVENITMNIIVENGSIPGMLDAMAISARIAAARPLGVIRAIIWLSSFGSS